MGFVHALPAPIQVSIRIRNYWAKLFLGESNPYYFLEVWHPSIEFILHYETFLHSINKIFCNLYICLQTIMVISHTLFSLFPRRSLKHREWLKHRAEYTELSTNNNVVCIPDIETHVPEPPGEIIHILVFSLQQPMGLSLQAYLQTPLHSA